MQTDTNKQTTVAEAKTQLKKAQKEYLDAKENMAYSPHPSKLAECMRSVKAVLQAQRKLKEVEAVS